MLKIVVIFIAVIILAIALPAVTLGVFDFRTDVIEETFVFDTAAAETNQTVQLAEDLWDASVAYATVVSNDTTEVPTTDSYTKATQALIITDLIASTGHILVVTYNTEGLSGLTGAEEGVTALPLAIIVSIIILPLILVYALLRGR